MCGAGAWPAAQGVVALLGEGGQLDQTRVVDAERDLDAVRHPELDQDVGDVGLDRGQAHVELAGDLGVGLAASDGDRYLPFALAEARQPRRRGARPLARRALGW